MYRMAARNGLDSCPINEGRNRVPHSQLIDSFCLEDEHFFQSYEAERVHAEESLTLECDTVEAQGPTTEQLAHLSRFHRPVAWIMAAMGALSLVALGQHGFHNSRLDGVAPIALAPAMRTSVAAENTSSASTLPGKSVFESAGERTSDDLWSWTEFAEDAIAFVLQPTPPRASSRELPALAASETARMQATQINDFTSELLSMCREASS